MLSNVLYVLKTAFDTFVYADPARGRLAHTCANSIHEVALFAWHDGHLKLVSRHDIDGGLYQDLELGAFDTHDAGDGKIHVWMNAWLAAEPNGDLTATREHPFSWEKFKLVPFQDILEQLGKAFRTTRRPEISSGTKELVFQKDISLLPFVTIAFSGELQNLVLQARSLAIYGKKVIKYWLIVMNDVPDPIRKKNIVQTVNLELEDAGFDVFWMERADVTNLDLSQMHGSRSQQILKICVSQFIPEEFYVLLDAKNHAMRELETGFFVQDGMPVVHHQEYEEWNAFYRWFRKAFDLVGLNPPKDVLEKYQSTTPYVMDTRIVQACMDANLLKSPKPWHHFVGLWGDDWDSITEFALYGAMSELHGKKLVHLKRQYVTLFWGWPSDTENIIKFINELDNEDIRFFGIHRDVGIRLGLEESELLAQKWVSSNLFSNVDSALRFLTWDPTKEIAIPR